MLYLVLLIILICVIGAVATIWIGISPEEKNYGNTTRARYIRLSIIYIVMMILLLALILYYAL